MSVGKILSRNENKIGKITFPNDWSIYKLSDILKLVKRPIKMEDQKFYNLVTIKRRFGGMVKRERLRGNQIQVKSQFSVKSGDFVISKRQISHGACAIVPEKLDGSIVSNEYNILRNKENLDLEFFNWYVQLPFMQRYFYLSSDGVHIEKLLFKLEDWLQRKVCIPEVKEQKKIAKIISTWDKAIELKEKLIEQKKKQKKGLMQKLLTGEVRLPGFYGEWEKVSFSDIFIKTKVKKHQIKTNEYLESGKYPVVDQGQKKVTAYSNDEEKVFEVPETGVIVFGDHTREIKFIDFDFIIGADGTQVLMTKDDYDVRFYYYHLLIQKIPNTGYNRHFKFLKEMIFNKPSLKEQKAISNLLSTIDKELDLLNAELSALNEQKKGLMQLLLTGKVRVKV
ncbi:restriction endonuclease subunit S [Heyndrickxia coagulans]|uniref:Restriction modification system DNA specificity subunit n=1 Tax=Heyndrickxia coagulans 36D1 TaxID=345219 RepID=G2TI43_HEYCO|nr:restriction endonuclease subunit S [Heyndrickxia coagulans]AEP00976.1 restriction modification system DNA specificity subunit [Heyndrickxia coagulans 36D1]